MDHDRVRTAHADAWEVLGRLRAGAHAVRDLRLSCSGLPSPEWNGADLVGPDPDLDAARAWYAHHGVPWGVRVPAGTPWPHGRHAATLPLMATDDPRPAPPVDGLQLRAATPDDAPTVIAVDGAAFGEKTPEWTGPLTAQAPHVTVALATLDGRPVATGYAVRSAGAAGPAVLLNGIATLPDARGRGIAAAVAAWLAARHPGHLAHLWTATPEAARIYERLGYAPAGTLEAHIMD